jgi:hypothetical protein
MRIHGIIEVQRYMSQWDMVVLIDDIFPRSINLCRHISYNDMNFDYGETVFANRGIPDDVFSNERRDTVGIVLMAL